MSNKAELQWPQYEVINVKNTLAARALVPGNPAEAVKTATRRADAAVKQLSAQFPAWMQGESRRLDKIRTELAENGYSGERLDQLFTCAHDIKGQATTYGYPVAAIIGKLLCDLIERAPDASKIPLAVIDQHVDSIRAIVRENIKGEGNDQTRNIINGLLVLDQTTLKKLSANQQNALTGQP